MVTRDAKIGLLVGLAFILIVGILLSEHVTTATAPVQASLAQAGDRVRQATAAPLTPMPVLANATIDPNPQPRQAVVTRDQLDSPQLPATARIELGRPGDGQIKVIRIDAPADQIGNAVAVKPVVTQAPSGDVQTFNGNKPSGVARSLEEAARQQGMEIVPTDGGTAALIVTRPEAVVPPIPNGARVKEYVAQNGDSLGRMASRLLGSNTPANRSAIVALNPSLQKDNNRILVGAKYFIPADAWSAALDVAPSPEKPAAKQAEPAKKPDTVATVKTVVYEVKAGDSLWKIAERELGTANAIAQIKQLNADVLGDSGQVRVGMKLKLPLRKA